jgi:hypothetical protein
MDTYRSGIIEIDADHRRAPRRNGAGPSSGGPEARPRERFANDMTAALRHNTAVNLVVRSALALFGFAAALAALAHTWRHGDALATAVDGHDAAGVLALALPVAVFVLLGVLAGAAAYTVHARHLDETYRTLEVLNRIEREGEVAVSARGLIFAFEEKLQNARRAFTLQLWLGRTMFLVCLGLLAACVVSALLQHGTTTIATGAGSLIAAIVGVLKHVPRNIGHNLADTIQIQSIITGCDRQISLLEGAALAVLKKDIQTPAAHDFVLQAQRNIDRAVELAVERIERYADPGSG